MLLNRERVKLTLRAGAHGDRQGPGGGGGDSLDRAQIRPRLRIGEKPRAFPPTHPPTHTHSLPLDRPLPQSLTPLLSKS